jgi:UDP-N-acetylmuramoyl-tripeptide--D-alanyl-D-alanine ligase
VALAGSSSGGHGPAPGSGTGTAVEPVSDVAAAVALLRESLHPGDVVLVKASRAASLERVAQAIADDPSGAGERAGGESA